MNSYKIPVLLVLIMMIPLKNLQSQGAYIPPDKPKLVVAIVIEQFRYDYIDKFLPILGENGIKRMINEGTFCKNSYYDSFFTQSAPAHATIATGADPRIHGIVSDNWYFPLRDEMIYCTGDSRVNPVGGSFENGLQSPANLLPSTYGDELKLATNSKARVFSVGMKDHAAILMGGHAADGAYWFDDKTGSWMSSTYYIDSLPGWVNDFNAMRLQDTYLENIWEPLLPKADYITCFPDSSNYEVGFESGSAFPYNLKKMSTKSLFGILNKQTDYSLLTKVPFGNNFTSDFAIRLIEEEGLGEDEITDYISVCYSATDFIGRAFGPSSLEMGDAIVRLDQDFGHLLDYLVDKLGKKNILVYFTSAHGIAQIPEVLSEHNIPSGRFKQNQALTLLKSYLNVVYGPGNWVKGYYGKQVYLNRTLIEDASLSLSEFQNRAASFLAQFSGVSAAVPSNVLENNEFINGYYSRMRNSLVVTRSGDIILNLEPAWIENGNYATSNNSVYEYDSHVPLIWFGWSVNRATINRRTYMKDIAATLSALCKIDIPNACTGEPIIELYR